MVVASVEMVAASMKTLVAPMKMLVVLMEMLIVVLLVVVEAAAEHPDGRRPSGERASGVLSPHLLTYRHRPSPSASSSSCPANLNNHTSKLSTPPNQPITSQQHHLFHPGACCTLASCRSCSR
jgi:hypothetical protein